MAGEKILIVEDQAIIAGHFQGVLRALHYTVPEPVATGEAALASVAAERPDIVLMDIGLPGQIDGITAAREIYAVWDIPIIFITAYSQDSVLQQAKAAAPYGYLIKPVSDRELAATLEMAFFRRSLDRPLEKGPTAPNRETAVPWYSEKRSILSPRQQEVLDLLLKGTALKRIATSLHISVQAVWKHQQKIFDRLGVQSVVELLARVRDS